MSPVPPPDQGHPDELLPWLVNHTLSESERREVEDHVQSCTRCQKEVAFLQSMRAHAKEIPSQSPGEFGLNRFLKEVKKDKIEVEQLQTLQRTVRWRTSVAIAASLIIFVQAGLLIDTWFLSKPMVPLSGPQEQGIVLQVTFTPTATESEIRQSVGAVNGTFIGGPGQLGVYRIRLNIQPTKEQEIHQAVESLRNQGNVVIHVARE